MKRLMIAAAALALMATASHAHMPHNRPCDIAQDENDSSKLNPPGGNAVMFGLCGGVVDAPIGDSACRSCWWSAFNCGYQAYRQRKVSNDNPYLNDDRKDGWSRGWKAAKKACATGRRPFYPPKDEAQ